MRRFLTALLVLGLFLPTFALAVDVLNVDASKYMDRPSHIGNVPDRFIVILKDGSAVDHRRDVRVTTALSNLTGFEELAQKYQVSRLQPQFPGSDVSLAASAAGKGDMARHYKVEFSSGTLEEAMADYAALPDVERVEPIGIHLVFGTPNDGYYTDQWHYYDTYGIEADVAWDSEAGNPAVVVGDLDIGTMYDHGDLGGSNPPGPSDASTNGNIWINTGEVAGNGIDDDGNGYIDDILGWDFVASTSWYSYTCTDIDCGGADNDPSDGNGHGTHTAGTIAAITNNAYAGGGVAGGWGDGTYAGGGNGVKVIPCRIGYQLRYLNQDVGVVIMDYVAEAMYYMAELKIAGWNVAAINCSFGSSNTGGLGTACSYLIAQDVLVVVAAGNSNSSSADYLGSRTDCLDVGATDVSGNPASFSNYGSWVDIAAPGVDVLSTMTDPANPGVDYIASMDGTSMSCPHVVGVAALLESYDPSLSAQDKWNLMVNNTKPYNMTKDVGDGIVDAAACLAAIGPTCNVTAAFTANTTSGCAPLTVNFTDQSTGTGVDGWAWTFGDGGTSSAQNPSHNYTAAGTYTVTLTATSSSQGCNDVETKAGYISVTAGPTASFTGSPTTGDYPLVVSFTNQSTGATSYSWNFGDGGNSTASSPSHTYTAAGTYTVTLTATNVCGSDQEVKTNYITVTTPPCYAPVADFFGSPTLGEYPLDVAFTDASTNSPTSWSWDFGDGGTSVAQNPSHTYTSAGTYTVALTAANSCGSDGEVKVGYIMVTEPTGWTVITYDDFESGFGTYTDGGADCSRYTGGTYAHQGSAALDIQDNTGTAASFYHTLGYDVSGYDDLEVEFWFRAVSMDNSTEDFWLQYFDGSSWLTVATWARTTDFENNIFYNEVVTISRSQYNFPTNARLRFMCDASNDADDVYIDEIEFRGGGGTPMPPTAAFVGSPTSGIFPLEVSFTDQSTDNPTSWSWTFGDGGTSTAQNPSHTYNAAGTYTVVLTATNAVGSDVETKTGYITVTEPLPWTVITYDDFESGFGSYTDGGGDCARYISGTYAHQGAAAIDIQDNSGTASSFYHTAAYDVTGYTELEVDFWFVAVSMDNTAENFWVQYFDGSTWQTVVSYARTTDFNNGVFYNKVVTISRSEYNFPTNARLRFMCDASDNNDDVYIDEVEFRGGSGGTSSISSITGESIELPEEFSLTQNYPNPFNPTTMFAFTLPTAGRATLTVYNVTGQKVATLVDGDFSAGTHYAEWDATEFASGVYFYRLQAGELTETKKMVLLK